MKYKSSLFLSLLIFLFLTGCTKNTNEDTTGKDDDYDYSNILTDYTNKTVVATYADLKAQSKLLLTAVNTFKANRTQANLDSACNTWTATRAPWEKSEAFLFGPVEDKGLDPLLDSWPLDQTQLEQVLAGSQVLTPAYVRDGLGAVLRGFHTIEYLLFRNGQPRAASAVTDREIAYLLSVTEVLRDDAITLWALWNGNTGITGTDLDVITELAITPGTGFAYEFKNAGKTGSRYASQSDAIEQIIQGCIDIADEVGNSKIAGPYSSKDVLAVESQYSWNSLTDFKNNIRSIENALYGGFDSTARGTNIAAYIKTKNATLEAEIKTGIQNTITAINGIPEPFRNNLNATTQIEAAMAATSSLNVSLTKVKTLLSQ
jgi:predicted lipoprotein